jgi:hypothetical protein
MASNNLIFRVICRNASYHVSNTTTATILDFKMSWKFTLYMTVYSRLYLSKSKRVVLNI